VSDQKGPPPVVLTVEIEDGDLVTADGETLHGVRVPMAMVTYDTFKNYRPATDTEVFMRAAIARLTRELGEARDVLTKSEER